VPQIMEAYDGQIGHVEQRLEVVHVEVGAPQRAAGGIAEDPRFLGESFADGLSPVFLQGVDDELGRIDAPAALGRLWFRPGRACR
jgi:hypothetical protein